MSTDWERDLLGMPALVWDVTTPPPQAAVEIEFLVPSYTSGTPDRVTLDAMPRLQVVQLLSAGYENWRPLIPDGVRLCNGRGVHGGSTAELAVGGLISVVRELPRLWAQQRRREWRPFTTDGLDGKRVLVLGAGDIGTRVATALAAFGATTTMVGRAARDGVHALADVAGLLGDAEVVVLAVPLDEDSRHLADAEFLAALPDGAVVVNVGRGGLVDTGALVAELTAGRLRAFLDVTDPEPLPADHPLWAAPNVLIAPHVGGGTRGWERRGYALVRDQVARWRAGQPLANVVI